MSEVWMSRCPAGESVRLRLRVSGHAGAGPKGRDLVCAAETMLVRALASMLVKRQEQLEEFAVEGEEGSGCVEITAVPKKNAAGEIMGAFGCVCCGFVWLAAEYPDHVTIAMEEEMAA